MRSVLQIEQIRTFIGIPVEGDAKAAVAEWVEGLKGRITGVKWVEVHNLHLTLRFLGDVPARSIDRIGNALLLAALRHTAFSITLEGAGVFPNPRQPRVLWVGVKGDAIAALHWSINETLQGIGMPGEERAFHPHLTIGRVRLPAEGKGIWTHLAGQTKRVWGEVRIDAFCLYKSDLTPQGPVYTELRRFELPKK